MFFKCNHPFNRLGVVKKHTLEKKDSDFKYYKYFLYCQSCRKKLELRYGDMIGGVEAFLKR